MRIEAGPESGDINVHFLDPPKYQIGWCESYVAFTNMPAENIRVWTITKTTTSLALVCNGVEIFNFAFSEASKSKCVPRWGGDKVEAIKFVSDTWGDDTASDKYRAKPTGNFLQLLKNHVMEKQKKFHASKAIKNIHSILIMSILLISCHCI